MFLSCFLRRVSIDPSMTTDLSHVLMNTLTTRTPAHHRRKEHDMPILHSPQRFTVCLPCREIIEYDPGAEPKVHQIVHPRCGGLVFRRSELGALYQYLIEAGIDEAIARYHVFDLEHGSGWENLRRQKPVSTPLHSGITHPHNTRLRKGRPRCSRHDVNSSRKPTAPKCFEQLGLPIE